MNEKIIFSINIIGRLVLAMLLGLCIGYERINRDKDAGMRTHAIVCLGSALFMIISKYGFSDVTNYDASRIASQVVSGIGFLGGGIIFVRYNMVNGLTTAAGIWATAGIGMACGAGLWLLGILSAALVLLIQYSLEIPSFIAHEPVKSYLRIGTSEESLDLLFTDIMNILKEEGIRVNEVKIEKNNIVEIFIGVLYPYGYNKEELIITLLSDQRVIEISG